MKTAEDPLFTELSKLTPTDSVDIDLGAGKEWLTSRLYLFSAILARTRGVRAITLLRTTAAGARQAMGSVSPAAICSALAVDEPWLEQTYDFAWHAVSVSDVRPKDPTANLTQLSAEQITLPSVEKNSPDLRAVAQAYIKLNQRSTEPPENVQEWQRFLTSPTASQGLVEVWEHTQWIPSDILPRALGLAVDTRSLVSVDPTESQSDLKRRILLQEGPFVVLVKRDGTLRGVVDRTAMVDQAVRASLETK